MGFLSSIFKFVKPAYLIAFLISALVGYFVASLFPAGPWTPYISMLVFYHLFLTWLVIDAPHKAGLSLPIVSAVLTHLALLVLILSYCMGLSAIEANRNIYQNLYAFVVSLGVGLDDAKIFGLLRFGIIALAFFERDWLFKGSTKKKEKNAPAPKTVDSSPVQVAVAQTGAPVNTTFAEATREDYAEWMNFVVKQKPPFPRPGSNLPAEYERWLIARNKSRTVTQ